QRVGLGAARAIDGHGMIQQAEAQAGQLERHALAAAALDAVGRRCGRLLSHRRHTPGSGAVADVVIEAAPYPAAPLDDGGGPAVQRALEVEPGVGGTGRGGARQHRHDFGAGRHFPQGDGAPREGHARLAGATRDTSLDARLGRAAFVALRLIDLLAPDQPALPRDAFHYQHAATERACRGLPADRPETSHLIGVVQSTADAYHTRDVGLLFPALFAYAHYLENEMCLEEALDVLETLQRVGGDRYRAEDRVAARLRLARVLRKVNRFDEAERAYEEAGSGAEALGDMHSQLLSRIGQAYAVMGRGNLGAAERSLRDVLTAAAAVGDREAEAFGHQSLAVVLSTSGRPSDAIPHEWHAYQLYEDQESRMRTLSDLGVMLLIVGDADGAERALIQIVRQGAA